MKSHYKIQLFSGFFIVGMLTLIISISISFSWFRTYIYREVNSLAKSQLDNIKTSYDMYLEQYRKEIFTIYNNPDVLSYLYSSDHSDFYKEYSVIRYLQTELSGDEAIDYILLFRENTVLMNIGTVFPTSTQMKEIIRLTMHTTNDDQQLFIDFSQDKQLGLLQTERVYLNGKSKNGVILMLNLQKLQNKFISREADSSSAVYILNQDMDSIIEKSENIKLDKNELYKNINRNKPGYYSFKTDIDGNKYIGNYLVNEEPNYIILTLQDVQSSEVEAYAAKRLLIIVSIILFLVTSVASYVLTQVLYKPFERFWSKIKNNSTLILPGENVNETRKIDITIDRIIERVSMLSQQHSHDELLKYLHDLQKDAVIPQILKIHKWNEQALLALCNVVTDQAGSDLDGYMEDLREMLVKEFPGCKITVYQESNKLFLILIKELTRINSFGYRKEVLQKYNRIIEKSKTGFGVSFQLVLSDTITEESEFRHEYQNLENYLRYHLIGIMPCIIDKEQVALNLDESVPHNLADQIMQNIREGNIIEATQHLNPLLDEMKRYQIKRVILFLAEFTTILNNLSNEFAINSREYKEHYLENYLKILSFSCHEELITWLSQLVTNTCLELRVAKEKTLRTNMIKSIEFIQNNYLDRNISVEALADQFHISTSYFSKLFREYTGASFPEYVNDLRLGLARELIIKNRTINMKKISDRIGFSSLSYFSAQFKKKYGVSPSQYRNNLENTGAESIEK